MAQDDWRVTVTLPAEEHSGRLTASLAEVEVEKDVHDLFGHRVIVGGGDNPGVVYLYTGTREAARGAEKPVHERRDERVLPTSFRGARENERDAPARRGIGRSAGALPPEGADGDGRRGQSNDEHERPHEWMSHDSPDSLMIR